VKERHKEKITQKERIRTPKKDYQKKRLKKPCRGGKPSTLSAGARYKTGYGGGGVGIGYSVSNNRGKQFTSRKGLKKLSLYVGVNGRYILEEQIVHWGPVLKLYARCGRKEKEVALAIPR